MQEETSSGTQENRRAKADRDAGQATKLPDSSVTFGLQTCIIPTNLKELSAGDKEMNQR